MATDYVLFVHGVRHRDRDEFEQLSRQLLQGIQRSLNDSTRVIKPMYLFWGDLNEGPQRELRRGLEASPQWRQLWLQEFRNKEVLEFVGDAALYLSRHVGAQVVRRFRDVALLPMQQAEPGDRLHLVTHSMGTVVLFDLLFAGRWEDERLDNAASTQGIRADVKKLRDALFGVGSNPNEGLAIASIHTMGSPLALFSLLKVTGESSHDLTSNLQQMLRSLHQRRGLKKLPWCNFIHPGDPIAYPLQGVMPQLFDDAERYVYTQDLITERSKPFFNIGLLPLLKGGEAHSSYWQNRVVAERIGAAIRAEG
jgi:hypothetical protein